MTAHQWNNITSKANQGRYLFIFWFCVYFLGTIIYKFWVHQCQALLRKLLRFCQSQGPLSHPSELLVNSWVRVWNVKRGPWDRGCYGLILAMHRNCQKEKKTEFWRKRNFFSVDTFNAISFFGSKDTWYKKVQDHACILAENWICL